MKKEIKIGIFGYSNYGDFNTFKLVLNKITSIYNEMNNGMCEIAIATCGDSHLCKIGRIYANINNYKCITINKGDAYENIKTMCNIVDVAIIFWYERTKYGAYVTSTVRENGGDIAVVKK